MMKRILRALACGVGLWAIGCAAGCDGSVTSNTGGGGSTGVGGHGGQGGKNEGGSGSAECPAEEPMSGAACDVAKEVTCEYGDACCPNVWGCNNGAWEQFDVSCMAPEGCPEVPPTAGAACGDVCAQWSPCGYSCDGTNTVFASCLDGKWDVATEVCSEMIPCGDTMCPADQICVASEGGAGVFYGCQEDPCVGGPLSCECAGSICGDPTTCLVSGPSEVTCSCPMCP